MGYSQIIRQGKKNSKLSLEDFTQTLFACFWCIQLIGYLTSRESFNDILTWFNESKTNVTSDCVYVLIGTKNDLERKVEFEEGVKFMTDHKIDLFFETSAKTGDKIVKVFEDAAREILKHTFLKQGLENDKKRLTEDPIKLGEEGKKKGCC